MKQEIHQNHSALVDFSILYRFLLKMVCFSVPSDYIIRMRDALLSKSELRFGKIPMPQIQVQYDEFTTNLLYELDFKCQVGFEEGITYMRDWLKKEEDNR